MSNNKYATERLYWVDILKSISIFGVVYIHSGRIAGLPFLNSGGYFRFCVPIFIFIFFFLSEYSIINSKQEYISFCLFRKKIIRLIIPYSFWSLIYALGQYYLKFKEEIDFGPAFAWQGQYFFVILFQLLILYPRLRLIKLTKNKMLLFVIFHVFCLYLPLNFLSLNIPLVRDTIIFFFWILYLFLGIYFARNLNEIKNFSSKIPLWLSVLLIVIIPFSIIIENFLFVINYPYLQLSVLLTVLAFVLFLPKFNYSLYFDEFKWMKTITNLTKEISSYSLGIFCLNPIIVSSISCINKSIGIENVIFSQTPILIIFVRFIYASAVFIFCLITCSLIKHMGGRVVVS